MSKSSSNLFDGTVGSAADNPQLSLNLSSINENIKILSKNFNISKSGYFGKRGKSSKVRVIESKNQFKTAQQFWNNLSKNGTISQLPNKSGIIVQFQDKSYATYRIKTSTKDSPAIDIQIVNHDLVKSQKIHFIKE